MKDKDEKFLKFQKLSETLTLEHYGKKEIYAKWQHDDARQRTKHIGEYIIVLNYGTERGGQIDVWHTASQDDIRRAQQLPWTFQVSEDEKYAHVFEGHYMDWENAVDAYRNLKTVKDIENYWIENNSGGELR